MMMDLPINAIVAFKISLTHRATTLAQIIQWKKTSTVVQMALSLA
jgi:hypothetical protein